MTRQLSRATSSGLFLEMIFFSRDADCMYRKAKITDDKSKLINVVFCVGRVEMQIEI